MNKIIICTLSIFLILSCSLKSATSEPSTSEPTPPKVYDIIYQIGDIGPAGGYIFYDDEQDSIDDIPGYRFLEVTKEDYPEQLAWGSYATPSSDFNNLTGANGTSIGTGYQNTLTIVANDNYPNKPADKCNDYSVTVDGVVYDDWFLPSKDELLEMKKNLTLIGLTIFEGKNYWSSSEIDASNAWVAWDPSFWGVWDGEYPASVYGLSGGYKAPLRNFRPIRAF